MDGKTNNQYSSDELSNETKKILPNRRGVRVRFAYLNDDEQFSSTKRTILIKNQPFIEINKKEDQSTKQFYENKSRLKRRTHFIESNNLQNDASLQKTSETIDETNKEKLPSSPIKSILKKPKENDILQPKATLNHLLPSHPPRQKRQSISPSHVDLNQVQHLAEITAKQSQSLPFITSRSLFDQTMNVFNPSYSDRISPNNFQSYRFQYYIKPYRGEHQISTNINKQRSKSLPQKLEKLTQSKTSFNRNSRPLRSKSDAIQDFEKNSSNKSGSSSPFMNRSFSSSNPCLQNDSLFSTSLSQNQSSKHSFQTIPIFSSYSQMYQQKLKHNQRMRRYDQLLENMRSIDQKLQFLSRLSIKNSTQKTSIQLLRRSTKHQWFSPMFLQICFITCLILNLILLYFFNGILIWWNEYIAFEIIFN